MTLRLYRAAKNRAMSVYHVAAMLVYAAAATDRVERPKARWTGMLRVPGFQVPHEADPSTSFPVSVQCLLAFQT
jgi:hypothetical protein